ncbi:hypothetical protein MUN88_17140 [Gracilibacillus caseinilyticus]|uniref:Uncharacterized protein n=1 Tax=Gracilibacillus caseinilyticus TaxID=2932256 RepID=A0ABY4EU62_9BACI|nr:hypothetical protein [Gracilibacillus caseinilyticus]UOQ47758.1 hypothetical protein MUN88_17140 [Gracilibacillus caseinilyticus]
MNYVDDILGDETIDINGQTYTKKEIEEMVYQTVKDIWNQIKSLFQQVAEYCVNAIKSFIEYVSNINFVGIKRELKRDELEYYESISDGKSNNWRKLHGLHIKRKLP